METKQYEHQENAEDAVLTYKRQLAEYLNNESNQLERLQAKYVTTDSLKWVQAEGARRQIFDILYEFELLEL